MSTDPNAVTAAEIDDEPYDSAEDEDFNLDAAPEESDATSEEDETEPAKKKRKTDKKAEIPEEELDSGDEATIRKARERKAKKGRGKKAKGKVAQDEDDDIDFDDDEEGGTGGFVRTRAMKKHIQEERKPLAKIDGATVDVDALWERMNAPDSDLGLPISQIKPDDEPTPDPDRTDKQIQKQDAQEPEDTSRRSQGAEKMIKIKRTYEFAGEMITEEKVVPKDSAEAKAYLSSGENVEYADVDEAQAADATSNLRRPLRKISRFDPNPTGSIKKSWEKQPVTEAENVRGPKINTVEKSRLDWAQYVDQAGIKDELRVHSKAKEGYIGRMDFLGRVEAKRDDEARQARLKGV